MTIDSTSSVFVLNGVKRNEMGVAMPRWLRVVRGMIGTGLTFAVGVGAFASIVGAVVWLSGRVTARELMGIAGKGSVVAFLLGVAFSGVLAITARGRQFNKLSLRLVSALGAGAGFLYFVFIAAANGARVWSVSDAIANFVLLTAMGAASAAATLAIARRANSALRSGDESHGLNARDEEIVRERGGSKVEIPRR